MKRILYISLLIIMPRLLLSQTTVGAGGTYPNLFEAFGAINDGNLSGDITLVIISNITETVTAVLYQTDYNGTSNYTSVTIYPDAAGYIIDGDIQDGPLIEFSGATNVVLDGRTGGASPDNKDLTIKNTSTTASASTIKFSESAATNTVRYCVVKGSASGSSTGIIYFSVSSSGNGNDNNTIDNNDITFDTTRPLNAIYSFGTSGSENSGNTISNNNIYDFLSNSTASNGILLSSNTTTFTVSGNSFYETGTFIPAAAVTYNIIKIDNTSGTDFTITGNYIGGQQASCGGSPLTKTAASNNIFYAIYLNAGTGSASSIQNNLISNISWSNTGLGSWTGIHIAAGAVNLGTVTGNTIGATTGTGAITVNCTSTGANIYGINIASTGTVDCRNNNIGSITVGNTSANSTNFTAINKTSSGLTTISNNLIGSNSTGNSINTSSASTGSAQNLYGINNAGTGTVTINSNTIANLTNSTTNANPAQTGKVNGILSSGGTLTISLNTIHDLTISNLNNTSSQTASSCGIALIGNTTNKTISGNNIYNISNSNATFAGHVIGLFFIGSTGTNLVSGNFIHNITVASGATGSVYGIKISSGVTTYYNNIISLGGTTSTSIYGIYETGALNNNNSLYFNTVYIGGSVGSGTTKTYALYSAVTTNTRNFRNNIFVNARSTTGGSGLHYAAWFNYAVSTNLTLDYNDYYVSGTGGVLGRYNGADVFSVPLISGMDVSSFAVNPGLSNPGGLNSGDYLASAAGLVAVTGTGITADYNNTSRSLTYPSMGALEYTVSPTTWTWTGTTDTDWSTATNWNYNTLPSVSGNVVVNNVTNDPVVNTDLTSPAECQNLTINSSGVLTVAPGKALKVNGTITNNAGVTGLLLRSDSYGNDAKLLNDNSSVPATVQLYLTGGAGVSGPSFHYVTPPVASMNINNSSISATAADLGLTFFNGDLILYDETKAIANKNAGWQYFDGYGGTTGFTSLVSSRGYNLYLTNNDVITFKGNLDGSAHTFNLSYTGTNPDPGWNLVGNPYPCNYDLNGISALINSGDGVDNTIYFNNSGGYAYWNPITGGTSGYSDILPPMQGFFVRATETGKSLSLPTTSKSGAAALPLRSKGASYESKEAFITVKKVKLALTKGSQRDETIVALIEDATPGFDSDYDAFKLFANNSTAPSLYSEVGTTKYAINTFKEPVDDKTIIPLRVIIKTAGEHKIEIPEFENLDGIKVVLKHGDNETILSPGISYTFSSPIGTFTNFELIIGEESIATGDEKLQEVQFKAWYSNNFIYITSPSDLSSGNSRMIIYDMQGKSVFNDNQLYIVPGEIIQVPVNLQKGIYVVHVLVNNQTFVSKVVIM